MASVSYPLVKLEWTNKNNKEYKYFAILSSLFPEKRVHESTDSLFILMSILMSSYVGASRIYTGQSFFGKHLSPIAQKRGTSGSAIFRLSLVCLKIYISANLKINSKCQETQTLTIWTKSTSLSTLFLNLQMFPKTSIYIIELTVNSINIFFVVYGVVLNALSFIYLFESLFFFSTISNENSSQLFKKPPRCDLNPASSLLSTGTQRCTRPAGKASVTVAWPWWRRGLCCICSTEGASHPCTSHARMVIISAAGCFCWLAEIQI